MDNLIASMEPAVVSPPLATIAVCEERAGLSAILQHDIELALWRRDLPAPLAQWLQELALDTLPDVQLLVRPSDLISVITPALDLCGISPGPMRAALVEDVAQLVGTFADITGVSQVGLRLERIVDNACWKFHRDCVEARLITTYRGPATEWVAPENADAAIAAQTDYAGPIERLRPHDVALFKGSCAGHGRGIVHRSPPIADTGTARLLLVLNKSWTDHAHAPPT